MNKLFSNLEINAKYKLKNRLAVAPMTTCQSNPDGSLSIDESNWLARLAEDGYGIVISCAAAISNQSIAFENQLSFENDSMIADLKNLTSNLKKHNSINIVQLCHAGSRSIKSKPYSASSYQMPSIHGFVPPATLSEEMIDTIISDFAAACKRVEEAGFDGIEFHGANGYIFTQFISKMTNLRDDKYGGILENRARFAREVVRACRESVSPDFIIGFRISFENAGLETGLDIDENIQIANWLAQDGIDYIHISSLDYKSASLKYPNQIALSYIKTKISSQIPIIGVGGITSLQTAEQAMEYGADIVAIGRAAIGNRFLPEILKAGKDLQNQNPFEESHLENIGLSKPFINYLRKMPVAALNVVK